MPQKQILLTGVCGMAAALLFLPAGCSEQKKAPARSALQAEHLSTGRQQISKSGAPVYKLNMEKGKFFNSGLYKKGRFPAGKPLDWTTRDQPLNDFTGWVSDEAHSGRRSLKIENIAGSDARWEGKAVIFKEPANAFEANIWTKTTDIKDKTGKAKFQLVFNVYLKGESGKEIKKYIAVNIPQTNHNWEKTANKALFSGNIIKIIPSLYFSETTGTVYFDDLEIIPAKVLLKNKKNLFNSNKNDLEYADSPNINLINRGISVKGKHAVTSNIIPFTPGRIYELSASFKSDGKKKGYIIFGFIMYDENKKFINYIYMYADYIPFVWTSFKGLLLGKKYGQNHIIPKNTKFIKVLCFVNWVKDNKGMELGLKDIELVQYSSEAAE